MSGGAAAVSEIAGHTIGGVRVPATATHWRAQRQLPDGRLRLSWGKAETGQLVSEWPVETWEGPSVLLNRWGPGEYRVGFMRREPGQPVKNLGPWSEPIRMGEPTSEPAPPPIASPATIGPRAGFCVACGLELAPAARFCATCGAPTGAAAARVAPPGLGAAGLEVLSVFQQGVNFATESLRASAEIARADANERIRRFEIETNATLERERMAHEKEMKEREEFFARQQKASGQTAKITDAIEAALAPIHERLDELAEDDDDDDDDEPAGGGESAPAPGSMTDKVNAAVAVADKLAPLASSVIDGAITAYGKLKNGGGSHASGSKSA